MDRLKLAVASATAVTACVLVFIAYWFGVAFLVRLILGLGFGLFAIAMLALTGILIYAKSKYSVLSLIYTIPAILAVYWCYRWHPLYVAGVIAFYAVTFALGVWWISEPDMSLAERLRSASSLEKSGNYRAAARKYEKAGNYEKAAECYLKAGLKESAAWCYERAENYVRAAELYEQIAREKKESYYWKEASEFYKKAGRKKDSARCLAEYAKEEPWYWEDVAKLYEEAGDVEKTKESWKKSLEYYRKEAEEEGVFWEDVARIEEKLGMNAEESWRKYLEYCINEAKKDCMWWKHVAEAYEKLGEKEKAEEARKRYEECRGG